MYEDATQPLKPITLADFLNELPDTPKNTGLSRVEIQQYIQEERQCWDK
jgi:hypothetical protein